MSAAATCEVRVDLDGNDRYDVRWPGETFYREVRLVIFRDGRAVEYGARRTLAGRVAMNSQHRSLPLDLIPEEVRAVAREALAAAALGARL